MASTSRIETKPMAMVDLGAPAYPRAAAGRDWSIGHIACQAQLGFAGTRVPNATVVRPEGLGGSPG